MNGAPPPPPPSSGLSTFVKVGLGCGVLLVLVMIGCGLLAYKLKDVAVDMQKAPVTTTAKMMVKFMPNMELVKADEATQEVTLRNTKTGETVTMSLDELKQGKYTVTDNKGNKTTVDTKTGKGVTVSGPDGTTVIGGDASTSAPPSWIPIYPGSKPAGAGMRTEKDGKVKGMAGLETADEVAKVKEFYDAKLKEAGFELQTGLSSPDSATFGGKKDDQSVQVIITRTAGKSTVMFTYEGPK